MTYKKRREREEIEQEGVPYIITAMIHVPWLKIQLDDINMVTSKEEQILGIDYIIKTEEDIIYIDSKYHTYKSADDLISIEITKANGVRGWGIDSTLATDYIIDFYNTPAYTGYYVLDCHKLHTYMQENYSKYSILYSNVGHEDYRGVPVKDLWLAGVIINAFRWDYNMAIYKEQLQFQLWYKNNIASKLPLLLH